MDRRLLRSGGSVNPILLALDFANRTGRRYARNTLLRRIMRVGDEASLGKETDDMRWYATDAGQKLLEQFRLTGKTC